MQTHLFRALSSYKHKIISNLLWDPWMTASSVMTISTIVTKIHQWSKKSEGSSQFNCVDKLLLILIWCDEANFFIFIFSTVMRLSYTPPPSIYNSSLCHLSSSRLGSDGGSLSVTTLLACLICLPSLWLTGYMNISMCCSERSGSGPPPFLRAGRGCTHSWCPQGLRGRRTGPVAGSVRAALQRGAWHDALL